MPLLTPDEIEAEIRNGRVAAVTLDTSIFDQHGCNLQYRALRSLDRLARVGVTVVFSEVTAREVQRHIARDAQSHAAKLRAAVNQYRKGWRLSQTVEDLVPAIDLDADAAIFSRQNWVEFETQVGAEILRTDDHVTPSQVLERFFEVNPPFANGAKTNEFPDAMALLSLESYAREKNTKILVISRDTDWKAFSEASERLIWIENLSNALDQFNVDARQSAERIVAMLNANGAPTLRAALDLELELHFEDVTFDVEGDAEVLNEANPPEAVVQHWVTVGPPLIVSSDDNEVTFSLDLECIVNFRAEVELYTWNRVDADYVDAGSTTAEREETRKVQATVTCKNRIPGEPAVVDVEISSRRPHVNFGRVRPQWPEDY